MNRARNCLRNSELLCPRGFPDFTERAVSRRGCRSVIRSQETMTVIGDRGFLRFSSFFSFSSLPVLRGKHSE